MSNLPNCIYLTTAITGIQKIFFMAIAEFAIELSREQYIIGPLTDKSDKAPV